MNLIKNPSQVVSEASLHLENHLETDALLLGINETINSDHYTLH